MHPYTPRATCLSFAAFSFISDGLRLVCCTSFLRFSLRALRLSFLVALIILAALTHSFIRLFVRASSCCGCLCRCCWFFPPHLMFSVVLVAHFFSFAPCMIPYFSLHCFLIAYVLHCKSGGEIYHHCYYYHLMRYKMEKSCALGLVKRQKLLISGLASARVCIYVNKGLKGYQVMFCLNFCIMIFKMQFAPLGFLLRCRRQTLCDISWKNAHIADF